MRFADRRAFTLIELMTALSISGLALLGGILLLDQVDDSSARISAARLASMRTSNGARLIDRLIFSVVPSADTLHGLDGAERSAEFWTTCALPVGWSAPCRVRLAIDQRGDSSIITADGVGMVDLALLRMSGAADFRYVDAAQDTAWMHRWTSSLGLPSAVVLATTTDTIVFPIAVMHD